MTAKAIAISLSLLANAAAAQPRPAAPAAAPAVPAAPVATYADLADIALATPIAAHVRLRRAVPIRGAEAAGVAAGFTRFYLEADLVALIRGEPGTSTQVRYVVDLPDVAGRPARPQRRSEWLIFARPVPGRPEELQLVSGDAQLPYSPALADQLRGVLREAAAPDAPPAITAIGRAFHTPGAVPGTSETQFFLQTERGQPISATVARAAGSAPRWFVSTSEFVDAGATQPQPNTLLWYRLACFLPGQLPRASYADDSAHAAAITADYQLVREGLGRCERLRRPRAVSGQTAGRS